MQAMFRKKLPNCGVGFCVILLAVLNETTGICCQGDWLWFECGRTVNPYTNRWEKGFLYDLDIAVPKERGGEGYCCGVGKCNIFCCNCEYGICHFGMWVLKRSTTNNTKLLASHAEKIFQRVDIDGDNAITTEEAEVYFENHKYLKRNTNIKISREIKEMDINDDGLITPEEFDESLQFEQ